MLYRHPSKSFQVSYGSTGLPRQTVADAYRSVTRLLQLHQIVHPDHQNTDASPVQRMRKFIKAQQSKTQIQLTLREVDELRNDIASNKMQCESEIALLESMLAVEARLRQQSMEYLRQIIELVPSAARVWEDIEAKSVFRIWVYYSQGECRPHYDPGFCTSLLCGSSEGLAVNFVDQLAPVHNLGDYNSDTAGGDAGSIDNWEHVGELLKKLTVAEGANDEPILTMSNTTLQVITGGTVPHVLHCVLDGQSRHSECSTEPRINMIVELRPKRSWYGFEPTLSERETLDVYAAASV